MTAEVLDRPGGSRGFVSDPPDTDERGTTTIADRVVEKIAAQAVAEVDRASGATRQVFGVSLGATDDTTRARVSATVDGGLVSVRVVLAVRWPHPVREVTREVRDHVMSKVAALTGLHVADVDIEVAELVTAAAPTRRVR